MKTWKAYAQINGDGVSYYPIYDFKVSDELHEKLQHLVDAGESIMDSEYYSKLKKLAEESLDWGQAIDDEDKPEKEDYDSEEEYEEALEEYKTEIDDNYCLERIDIYDPGDLVRFKNHFIGKEYSEWANGRQYDIRLEFDDADYRCVHYRLTITLDKNGIVIGVSDVFSEALAYESFTHSSYAECYPDYDCLEESIEEFFEYESPEDYWDEGCD